MLWFCLATFKTLVNGYKSRLKVDAALHHFTDYGDTMPNLEPKPPSPYPYTLGGVNLTLWSLKMIAGTGIMGLGALYGVSAYKIFALLFSAPAKGVSGLMLVSFLAGIPFAMGMLISYFVKRRKLAGWVGSGTLSLLSIVLVVFAAGALLREGTVCIVMALPIFIVLAILGVICTALGSLLGLSNSPKLLSVGLFMPFMLAPLEQRLPATTLHQTVTQSIFIAAPPATIWQHINYPLNIQKAELKDGLVYQIGVPYPMEARTLEGKVGGLRALQWERGVKFAEIITAWEPNHYIAWDYKFTADSFPPGSLDEHIVIGGHYFNVESTAYVLQPEANGTRLTIQVNTSVSTNFNHYADFWARFLVTDTAKTILQFYKTRAESPSPSTLGSRL